MSSLASAPSGAAPDSPRAARATWPFGGRASLDLLTGAGLAGALALLAFTTTGGADLRANTWGEIALVLVGAALAAALALQPSGRPHHGLGTFLALGGFSGLTALSIAWSEVPDQSWLQANRMLAYLAAFGAAIVLVRRYGERWRGVLGGLGTFAVALSGWALLGKVFPGALDPVELFGRLRAPFGYWNATGVVAAMGLAPLVWSGARPDGRPLLRALSVPAISLLLTALVLSYSRSALLAAVCGLGLWFTLVPLRLRGAGTLALGALGGAGPTLWALHTGALTQNRVALGARIDAGHGFGIVLALSVLAFTALGLAGAFAADRSELAPELRRRIGTVLVVAVALVPVGALGAATVSNRGLTGQISHVWNGLTDPHGGAIDTPGRLVQLGNTRSLYWSEGITVGEHHPLVGVGAGGYATARTRYTTQIGLVAHAHSFVIETFAELGILGLLVSLALFASWLLATLRTFGRGPRAASAPPLATGERAGLLTLACVVVTFGVHSSIDWTWEIPGTAVPALFCAAWLAGRAPVRPRRLAGAGRRPLLAPALGGLAAAALLAGWAIWQPLRSSDAVAAAQNALVAGNGTAALAAARAAAARDPLAPEPLWAEADVLTAARQIHAAHAALVQAITLEPENAATWRTLGFFDIAHGQPHKALGVLARAHLLDPTNPGIDAGLQQAQTALAQRHVR